MSSAQAPVVSLRQASLTYPGPPAVPALIDADLDVDLSDYLAITGPSGSGKSTLLNILGLLSTPSAGSYRLEGADTTAMTDRQRTTLRADKIGFVFQSFHLVPYRDAVENVELGLLYSQVRPVERTRRALDVLAQVGLTPRAPARPNELSGGERQRVAIARALVRKPSLLLCDEPTGNLDTGTSEMILDLLDQLHSAGNTIIVITHDPSVARRATRRVEIRDGRIREPSHATTAE